MPVVIPAIAGFAASSMFAGSIALSLGVSTLVAGLAVGALTGAVVGGLQSAIQGGDILEGVLYGAVGGAVGGAIGGFMAAPAYGSLGAGDAYTAAGSEFIGASEISSSVGLEAAEASSFTVDSVLGAAPEIGGSVGTAGDAGLLGGLSNMDKLLMATSAKDFIASGTSDTGALSMEEQKDLLEYQTDQEIRKIDAQGAYTTSSGDSGLAQTLAQIAQSERESLLNAELVREQISSEESNLAAQLSQQEAEMNKPYEEEKAKRERIISNSRSLIKSTGETGGMAG